MAQTFIMQKSTCFACLLYLTAIFLLPVNSSVVAQVTENKAPEKVMDFNPTSKSSEAQAFFKEGLAAYDMGENRKARDLFTKAIEKDPDFGLAYLLRSNSSNSTKEWVDDINAGKSKMANASEWEKMYADYLYTDFSGDREKGMELAKKMAETYPDAARAQMDLGNSYFNNKQYDLAAAAFEKSVSVNPSWSGGYGGLVNVYLFGEKKDLAKAEQNALKVVSLKPNNPGAHILLGDTYRAQNNMEKARDEYKKSIELDPKSVEGYYKLGHSNIYLGNSDEARKNFKDAGERDSQKSFSQTLLATSYAYEGDSKKTMKELIRLASLSAKADGDKNMNKSDQLTFLNQAANVALHNNDVAALKQLLPEMKPLSTENLQSVGTPEAMLYNESDMLYWEAIIDALEGKFDAAKEKAGKMKTVLASIKDGRKDEPHHELMGIISMKQKNYKEAIVHLNQANQQSIYCKYLLAKSYEGLEDKAKAKEYYTEVSNYNFNNISNALIRHEVKKKLKSM